MNFFDYFLESLLRFLLMLPPLLLIHTIFYHLTNDIRFCYQFNYHYRMDFVWIFFLIQKMSHSLMHIPNVFKANKNNPRCGFHALQKKLIYKKNYL